MGRVLVNGQVKWTTKIIAVSRFFLSLFIWMWWGTTKSGNKQSESGKLNGHETIQSNQSDSFGTWNWAVVERMGRYTQYRQKQLILNQWLFISFTRFCSFFCSEEKKTRIEEQNERNDGHLPLNPKLESILFEFIDSTSVHLSKIPIYL